MQFTIDYKGRDVVVDVTLWESAMNDRIEFYVVFAEQQETFINFVKRKDQPLLIEESSSADLPTDIKAVIKERLLYISHNPDK